MSLGLTEADPKYWEIYRDIVATRSFILADHTLNELEKAKVPPKAELTEKEKEEIARQYMEAKGLLKTETGSPTATTTSANLTIEQVKAMDEKTYFKVFPKGTSDVLEAIRTGKVKV